MIKKLSLFIETESFWRAKNPSIFLRSLAERYKEIFKKRNKYLMGQNERTKIKFVPAQSMNVYGPNVSISQRIDNIVWMLL